LPKVTPPSPVIKLMEGRLRREMAEGMYPLAELSMRQIFLSEWQSKASYLGLAANVDEGDRRFCEDLLKKHFLTTENRNRLERVWLSCCTLDRADAAAR
jgi:hypothetical protein